MLGSDRGTCHNIASDRHENVFAEGPAMESYLLGPEATKTVTSVDRNRLTALYPTRPEPTPPSPPQTARPTIWPGGRGRFAPPVRARAPA